MNLRSLDWRYLSAVSTFALVVFGAGVSLGRYIPAQHGDESTELRDKLAHICTGEEVSGCTFTILHIHIRSELMPH
jgi:hypothetical protein